MCRRRSATSSEGSTGRGEREILDGADFNLPFLRKSRTERKKALVSVRSPITALADALAASNFSGPVGYLVSMPQKVPWKKRWVIETSLPPPSAFGTHVHTMCLNVSK